MTPVIVDILMAIDVPFARTLGAFDIDAIRENASGIVRQTARKLFPCLFCEDGRSRCVFAVCCNYG